MPQSITRVLLLFVAGVLCLGAAKTASAQSAFQTCYDYDGLAHQIATSQSCIQAGFTAVAGYQICYDALGNPTQLSVAQTCSGSGLSAPLYILKAGFQACYDIDGIAHPIVPSESCGQAGLYTAAQNAAAGIANITPVTSGSPVTTAPAPNRVANTAPPVTVVTVPQTVVVPTTGLVCVDSFGNAIACGATTGFAPVNNAALCVDSFGNAIACGATTGFAPVNAGGLCIDNFGNPIGCGSVAPLNQNAGFSNGCFDPSCGSTNFNGPVNINVNNGCFDPSCGNGNINPPVNIDVNPQNNGGVTPGGSFCQIGPGGLCCDLHPELNCDFSKHVGQSPSNDSFGSWPAVNNTGDPSPAMFNDPLGPLGP